MRHATHTNETDNECEERKKTKQEKMCPMVREGAHDRVLRHVLNFYFCCAANVQMPFTWNIQKGFQVNVNVFLNMVLPSFLLCIHLACLPSTLLIYFIIIIIVWTILMYPFFCQYTRDNAERHLAVLLQNVTVCSLHEIWIFIEIELWCAQTDTIGNQNCGDGVVVDYRELAE